MKLGRTRSSIAMPEGHSGSIGWRSVTPGFRIVCSGRDVRFDTDESLLAGSRIELSSMAVDASLAAVLDEVRAASAEPADSPEQDPEARDT